MKQDFTKPAINDKTGHCINCGRDNRGYKGEPCHNDCPMYWEEIGIPNPDYPNTFVKIGGGYSFQPLRVGMIVRAPNGKQIYIQPGDDENAMRANIEALDEISEDVTDSKRGIIADMTLAEYFA